MVVVRHLLLTCLTLVQFSDKTAVKGQMPRLDEAQVRAFCRKLNLGSVCDLDLSKLCQNPQLTWICKSGTTPSSRATSSRRTTPTRRNGDRKPTTASPNRQTSRRSKFTTMATSAPPVQKGQPVTVRRESFTLSTEQKQIIKGNCNKKSDGCQAQSPEITATKAIVSDSLAKNLITSGKAANQEEAEKKAQEIMQNIHNAKRALYDTQGLDGIEPNDDGLWQKDLHLNEQQSQYIIKEVTGANPPPTTVANRGKRFAMFLQNFPNSKWQLPIGYVVGTQLSTDEAAQVRRSFEEIQQKTCIRFYEDTSASPRIPYITFAKYVDSASCGMSPLGNQNGVNTIWLNFNCDNGYIVSTIIHEILHSLSIHHHQIRVDRDDWITIDWSNVDPQAYDLFDGRPYMNSYTTYGVPYDMYSVMHYHSYVGILTPGKPNMIPKYFPEIFTKILGQRVGLSDGDAELLRKIYCENDCNDNHVWCGYWANSNYCLDQRYISYMRPNCQKSCGFCPGVINS